VPQCSASSVTLISRCSSCWRKCSAFSESESARLGDQRVAHVGRLALPLDVDQQHARGLLRQFGAAGALDQPHHQRLHEEAPPAVSSSAVVDHHCVGLELDARIALAEGSGEPPAAGRALAVEQAAFGEQEAAAAGAGDADAAQVQLAHQLHLRTHGLHAHGEGRAGCCA
jgi:hypothetical protein